MTIRILHGDCIEVMKTLPDASVDSIVTDPPAGIGFMGKGWDSDKGGRDQWIAWMQSVADECLRVLKPGGHALVWALPRTSHWTATAWENAGFEVRDRVAHVFGSGFPKSLDVSKAIDKAAGAKREVVGCSSYGDGYIHNSTASIGFGGSNPEADRRLVTEPTTDAAKQWQGWGTALKPAMEDWWLLRKPLAKGNTVAANVLAFGTGAINVDACRVEPTGPDDYNHTGNDLAHTRRGRADWRMPDQQAKPNVLGRWPSNVIHDGSDEVLAAFPQTTSVGHAPAARGKGGVSTSGHAGQDGLAETRFDTGSAARFFYTAKASAYDRNDGTYDLRVGSKEGMNHSQRESHGEVRSMTFQGNHHPTVKPTELMRYLCRLITPPGGTVLDPFMGSGSTLKAAELEGFSAIGIEIDPAYVEIARRRIGSDFSLFVEIE